MTHHTSATPRGAGSAPRALQCLTSAGRPASAGCVQACTPRPRWPSTAA
jgi:hypothetical protein